MTRLRVARKNWNAAARIHLAKIAQIARNNGIRSFDLVKHPSDFSVKNLSVKFGLLLNQNIQYKIVTLDIVVIRVV